MSVRQALCLVLFEVSAWCSRPTDPATNTQVIVYHKLLMPLVPLLVAYMLLGEYQERRR